MKKVISLILVLTMAIGLAAIPVFASTYATPERTKTKTFYLDDQIFATQTATIDITIVVTGVYSSADGYGIINNATATFSGALANSFSYQYRPSGDDGIVYVYLNGTLEGKYTFSISSTGTITYTLRLY